MGNGDEVAAILLAYMRVFEFYADAKSNQQVAHFDNIGNARPFQCCYSKQNNLFSQHDSFTATGSPVAFYSGISLNNKHT